MSFVKFVLILFFLLIFKSSLFAQDVRTEVSCTEQLCDQNHPKTVTVFYPKKNSKAVIFWVKGGPGTIANHKNYSVAINLIGKFDLIAMASPYRIYRHPREPDDPREWRTMKNEDQVGRIKSIIKYYKKKTNKPIILAGDSTGCTRIMTFLNHEKDNVNLVDGIILSSCRTGKYGRLQLKYKNLETDKPILMIHHKFDHCWESSYSNGKKLFKKLKKKNTNITHYTVTSGYKKKKEQSCSIGSAHAYAGAIDEFTEKVVEFTNSVTN